MREDFRGAGQGTDRLPLMTKVAKLYHESGLRQPEIADRLNISQSRVSRLLKQAVEMGIVRTVVVPPDDVHSDLEMEMAQRFDLLDVVIAEPLAEDEASLLAALGAAAATYLGTNLTGSERIGLSSWSSTLLAAVNVMAPNPTQRLASDVIQVIGGVGNPRAQIQANHLSEQLARVTGASPHFFLAPGLVGSRAARDALLEDRYIGALPQEWGDLTTLLAGIGTLEPSTLLASSGNAIDEEEAAALRNSGAIGDVCLRFFDVDGTAVATGIDERVLGIRSDQLFAIPRRIGVAGGRRKRAAIRGAVRGGWINILVTDLQTATELLQE